MMDTATAARVVAGRAVGTNVRFTRVTTDSRNLQPGDLFVALAGERFDGHDFVRAALAQGAAAALVASDRVDAVVDGPLIAVPDPLAPVTYTLPCESRVISNPESVPCVGLSYACTHCCTPSVSYLIEVKSEPDVGPRL